MRCISAVLLTIMLISSVVALTFCPSVDGETIDKDGFYYEITGPDTVTLYEYDNDTEPDVVIPEIVPDTSYMVTAITATFDQECIINISIPGTVRSLDGNCFIAPNLTTITVAGGTFFKAVDGVLFNFNQSKLIKYPCGKTDSEYTVSDLVVEIAPYAFEDAKVEKVTTGDNLVIIGNGAFYNTESMTTIVIPESSSLTMIGDNAFCNSAITSIALPWTLSFLGSYAFENTKLTTVTVSTNIEHIGTAAFSRCSLLTAFVSESSSYTVEDGVLFHKSKNIKSLTAYPSGKGGAEYTIPADVNSIEPSAFCGTVNLEKVTLNNNLTSVPEMSFYDCGSLKSIDLSQTASIGNMAFYGCEKLTGVEFSDRLTYIGYGAFSSTAIQSIDIPSGVTLIGIGAFSDCMNLNGITFAESNKATVSSNILYGCLNLQNITINSKDLKLEEDSLSVGMSEHNKATVNVLVPSGYKIPDNASNEFTTLNVSYIGERPYPWVNIVGAVVCGLGIIGILYGMRQV